MMHACGLFFRSFGFFPVMCLKTFWPQNFSNRRKKTFCLLRVAA